MSEQARQKCQRKRKYASKHEAHQGVYALIQNKETERSFYNFQVYKCKFCDGWHFGHTWKFTKKQNARVKAGEENE